MAWSPQYSAFYSQRHTASRRGIRWRLSYEQWLGLWTASGKLDQRGRRSLEYCMARIGDRGAYAVGNVRIVTNRENHLERDGTAVAESNRRRMKNPVWARKVVRTLSAARAKNNANPEFAKKRIEGIRKYWEDR